MNTKKLTLKGDKMTVMTEVEKYLQDNGFKVVARDFNRPWGGFFVLDEGQAEKFGAAFFPGIQISSLRVADGKLSPKILIVEADKRLSWQYHHRRSEIWKLVAGTAGVVTSRTDVEGALKKLETGEVIRLQQGERHRVRRRVHPFCDPQRQQCHP